MGGNTHSEPIRHGRNSHAGRMVMEKSMQVKEMNAAARSRYFTLASGLILHEVDGVVLQLAEELFHVVHCHAF